jgi:tetratricopeptide (TPR) repeat protein
MTEQGTWLEIRGPLRLPRWEAWTLGALVLLALLMRITLLGVIPPGLELGEARLGLAAHQHSLQGLTQGAAPEDGQSGGLLFTQAAALLFDLLGTSVFSLRLTAALIAAATVAALYLLARPLYGVPVAIGAAALLATSRWHLRYSRSADPTILGPLLATLAVYLFYCCLAEGSWLRYGMLGLVLGLSLYCVPAVVPTLAVLALLAAAHLLAQRGRAADRLRGFLLAAGVALLLAAPLLVIRPASSAGAPPENLRAQNLSVAAEIAQAYWVGEPKDGHPALGGAPLLGPVEGALLILGIVWMAARIRREPEGALLPIAWFVIASLAPVVGWVESPTAGALVAIVPITLLGALALGAAFNLATKRARPLGLLTLAAPVVVSAVLNLRGYLYWAQQPEVVAEFSGDMPEFVTYLRELAADQRVYLSPYVHYSPNVRFLSLGAEFKLVAGPAALTFGQQPKRDLVYVVDCEPLEAMVRQLYPQARQIRSFSVWGEDTGRFLLVYRDEVRSELTDAERVEAVRLQRQLVRLIRSRYEPWLWRTMSRDPEYLRQSLQPRSRLADLPQAEAFIAIGQRLIAAGEFERARRNFQIAALLEPDSFEAHYALGAGNVLTGRWEEALAHWQECLRIDPRNEKARRQLKRTRTLTLLRNRGAQKPVASSGQ